MRQRFFSGIYIKISIHFRVPYRYGIVGSWIDFINAPINRPSPTFYHSKIVLYTILHPYNIVVPYTTLPYHTEVGTKQHCTEMTHLTRAGVCKTLCPNICLSPNMAEIPQKFWTLLKRLTGNLHIILYQLTKFQAPSSNSFPGILLTSSKCPNFQRAITPKK